MADDALTLVRMRNNFYRDNYRRVLAVLLLMVLINIALVGIVYYQMISRPQPEYFATTADGRLIRLRPLGAPMISQDALLSWANQAAIAVYNYNYVNYVKSLQEASRYFTPDGWKSFQDNLKSSGNLKTVLDQKLQVTAVATGAPTIINQGVVNNRYTWKVQMPLLVTYQSASVRFNQSVLVNMIIQRVSVLQFPKGIAVSEYVSVEQPIAGGS